MKFCVKIHTSYRKVVAICDSELIDKKFEEDKRQLDLRESFFKEKEIEEAELRRLLKIQVVEDATFNIVGNNTIKIAIEEGLISPDGTSTIQGIPFALKLI